MKTIKLLILLMVVSLGMQSCRKDSDIIDVTPNTPPKGIKVQASVMGTVVDENGAAVEDAVVTYADLTETTDQYGVFQFNDETLYSDGTYITVEKDGYFKGSRKFYPVANATSRINVELLSMVEVSSFSSSAGQNVQFEGTEITFGTNSIMREDGSDYNGNVKVFAKYLDPTLLSTLDQMPGDLTATNANDERVVLTTYGMVAVELRDDSGNELQVKTGMSVAMSSPVPAELLASAPQTIPMWHFDENLGTWVEEGAATLVNGVYETQVSHFSFWNYDVPSDFIFLTGSVMNRGIPVENVVIKITNTDDGTVGSGVTNGSGIFGGYVPDGAELTIEVYDQCGSLIYTTTVGPFSEDVVLDPFNLNVLVDQVTVSGTVTACDGEPSDATYVVIEQADYTSTVSLDENNDFTASVFYCNSESEITVGAVDLVNGLASANTTYTINGDIDGVALELCEESLSQHLYYQYGDQELDILSQPNGQDSLTLFGYNSQIFSQSGGDPDKVIYSVFVGNWDNTNNIITFDLEYQEGSPIKTVTMPVPQAGFNATGEATIQIVSQGGADYLTATGTLSDIEVTDDTLYDDSYNPLFFNVVIKL